MNVLFVAGSYYPHVNGVYTFVRTVATALKKEGYRVAVLAPSPTINFTMRSIDGITVYGVPSFSFFFYKNIRIPFPFELRSILVRIIHQFAPDIIHIQDHFAISKAIVRLYKTYHIPIVATNHFMSENFTFFFKSARIQKKIDQWSWAQFSKVFNEVQIVTAPTQTAANIIRPKLKKDVRVISNGIALEKFTGGNLSYQLQEKYALPDEPILLYVGRIDPEKQIDQILHAISSDNCKTKFCFVAIGKGVQKKALEALAKKLGISNRTRFTGYVPDEDLIFFYRESKCFITASIAELQSIATMEAMASGLPIVAVNVGALSELVHENENGFLFSPGDAEKMLRSIQSIFNDEGLFKKMGSASLQLIQQHRIEKTISSFKEIYDDCLRVRPNTILSEGRS